jgi:hypothetical protein
LRQADISRTRATFLPAMAAFWLGVGIAPVALVAESPAHCAVVPLRLAFGICAATNARVNDIVSYVCNACFIYLTLVHKHAPVSNKTKQKGQHIACLIINPTQKLRHIP